MGVASVLTSLIRMVDTDYLDYLRVTIVKAVTMAANSCAHYASDSERVEYMVDRHCCVR